MYGSPQCTGGEWSGDVGDDVDPARWSETFDFFQPPPDPPRWSDPRSSQQVFQTPSAPPLATQETQAEAEADEDEYGRGRRQGRPVDRLSPSGRRRRPRVHRGRAE